MNRLDIKIQILPPQLIIKDFVKKDKRCDYEIYLRELINTSSYFLKKSNDNPYTAPLSEENGQCDCLSPNYKLDFKLLLSETMGQGQREFSTSITRLSDDATAYGDPNIPSTSDKYMPINATYLHVAFRTLGYERLCEIANTEFKQRCFERDVHLILKDLRKPKNLLCMLPYEFSFDEDISYDVGCSEIVKALNADFINLITYRRKHQPQFDTYIAFIFHKKIIILSSEGNIFTLIDEIELTKSKTYQELARYSDE